MGIERESIQKRAEALPEELKNNLTELSREGRVEDFFDTLTKFGISATEQTEYASHFMQELREGLKIISWNKERLMYTAALVEHTIMSSNPNPASSENLVRNYLVFCRIFKNQEGVLPRFGQFSYIMRAVFSGVVTKDEIFQRINDHKTFGESDISQEEINAFYEDTLAQINQIETEVGQAIIDARAVASELKRTTPEATEEERREKGVVWSGKYSEPKEYIFPNYTFQTGNRRGLNTAVGRSSWEPMFLAFMDMANGKMEEGVNLQAGLSEEQKKETIKRKRIELLYEPFEFPVGIKKTEDGQERAVIYILDFIDINRWRAIEIKGPLTPTAAEKIKAFKKYYIDQDFSDLPEDQKIVMMGLVAEKLEEVKRWCKKNNYPVFDHFTDYQVFGAQRWDFEFNNFNSYKQPVDTRVIPQSTQESLQTGLIKFIEDKFPNLKPQGYINADDLPKLIKINKDQAKKSGEKYIVEKALNTEPFMPAEWVENYFRKNGVNKDFDEFDREVYKYIFNTVPISNADIERCNKSTRALLDLDKLRDILKLIVWAPEDERKKKMRSGVSFYVPLPNKLDLSSSASVLKDIYTGFNSYVAAHSKGENPMLGFRAAMRAMSDLIEGGYDKKHSRLQTNYFQIKDVVDLDWADLETLQWESFLGKNTSKILGKRFNELRTLFTQKTYEISDITSIDKQIQHLIDAPRSTPDMFFDSFFLFANKVALAEKLPRNIRDIISLKISLVEVLNKEYMEPTTDLLKNLYDSLIDKFGTKEEIARGLSSSPGSIITYEECLTFIKTISLIPMSIEEMQNAKFLLSISQLVNLVDSTLKSLLGDKYESCERAIQETLRSEQFQALKSKAQAAT